MRDKYVLQSFLILNLAVGILLLLQWIYPHSAFLKEHFKTSRLISYYFQDDSGADSLLLAAIDSSVFDQLDTLETDTLAADSSMEPVIRVIDESWFKNDSFVVPDTVNLAYLAGFLKGLKTRPKSRIFYWGDSMIEGDLITQTLRRKLRKDLGGSGVGFVPMISITAGFRRTVLHSFGGPWNYYSVVKNAKTKVAPFGINAEYMVVGADSTGTKPWAQYRVPKGRQSWTRVQVLYGKGSGKGRISVTLNKGSRQTKVLSDTAAVNRLVFRDTAIREVSIRIDSAQGTIFYGVSLESETGIQVDNLSLRGNSGMALSRISSPVLQGFGKWLEPDLIVLHFGLNVINAAMMDYHWYERAMLNVVNHYQRSFPGIPILIIGVADKGFKKGEEMVSDPSVVRVLKTQYKVALKTGVAFWNLYAAMGGDGSMTEWVENPQPKANKDYTHLNFRGAEFVGNLIYAFLMKEGKKYE